MPSCRWWHGTFRQGTSVLCCQGLESSWKQHRAACTRLYQGLRDLGLELFVKEEVGAGFGHSPVQLGASLVLERDPGSGKQKGSAALTLCLSSPGSAAAHRHHRQGA